MILRVSKYRDELMGMAILWIMLHHSNLYLPNPWFGIKRLGYSGVDIFLFVSGLGCAVSLSRNRDYLSFLIRRIKRIYPHYIPVLLLFLLIHHSDVSVLEWVRNILGNITGFSFWAMSGNQFNWYILAILFFYILAPILFEILSRYNNKGLVGLMLLSFAAGYCFAPTAVLLKAVARFPIYILGIYAGIRLASSNDIPDSAVIRVGIYLCGAFGFVILLLMYKYQKQIPKDFYNVFYPCILTTAAIILALCSLFAAIRLTKIGGCVLKALGVLGRSSLDLYLLHIVLFRPIDKHFENMYDNAIPMPFDGKNALIWAGIFVLIILASLLYRKIVSSLESAAVRICTRSNPY